MEENTIIGKEITDIIEIGKIDEWDKHGNHETRQHRRNLEYKDRKPHSFQEVTRRGRQRLDGGVAMGLQAMPQREEAEAGKQEGIIMDGYKHATREDLIGGGSDKIQETGIKSEPLIWINVEVGENLNIYEVIDSGATHSCIDQELYDKLLELNRIKGELPVSKVNLIIAAGRRKIRVNKQVMFEISLLYQKYNVLAFVVADLFTPMVLGLNWLREHKIVIDCEKVEISTKETPNAKILESGEAEGKLSKDEVADERKVLATVLGEKSRVKGMCNVGEHRRSDKTWGSIIKNIEEHGRATRGKKNYCIYGEEHSSE